MARHELLNNIEHKELKINTEKSAVLGNNTTYTLVYPFEFKHVQADYPIFFLKDKSSDSFNAIALFGFEQSENLFLTDEGWQASYIPMMIEREPFLIGYQKNDEASEVQPVIHIDMESPRVGTESGTSVFLEHGGNSDYINRISTILKTIHDSKASTELFIKRVTELELIEPLNLDIKLNDGTNNRLSGFYTINEDKLTSLNGQQLEELNKSGLLHLIYMVIASHANLTSLIQKKDKLAQLN
ncbi:SapC family protein [Thalassotalea atypica]|uniref:SapC family protein n=1 Tax=Thalassotalea atypica TaxID=2054316 RepID=UPI0025732C8B|nr:SapC family protein [Thalassotalea atypica]